MNGSNRSRSVDGSTGGAGRALWLFGLASLLVAGLPGTSRAADGSGPVASSARSEERVDEGDGSRERVGIAVLDVQTSGDVDPLRFAPLSPILGTEVARYSELHVVTGADIRNMLGFESQRQLLGCEADTSCLAEIGGALGVPYVLASEGSMFGGRWNLTLSLLDVENARPVARVGLRADTEAELADQLPDGVRQVLASLLTDPAAGPPSHGVPRSRRPVDRGRVLAWSLAGTGAAMVVGGGSLYGYGWNQYVHYEENAADGVAVFTRRDARRIQGLSDLGMILVAGGAAMVTGGILLPHVNGGGIEGGGGWVLQIVPQPLPDGGVVTVEVLRW